MLVNERALALKGVRELDFLATLGVIISVMTFSAVLLELLLGLAFVYGACDRPIQENLRVLRGVLWSLPLSCE